MATTKIFSVSVDELASLKYIANPEKTDNGRLIITEGCSSDPEQAHHDFQEIRKCGTGKSTVLAQHFIVSFKPGEILPERALQVGQEICEQFLKGEYQYFMACHIDKEHTHLHCVFNNTNCIDGRTFETHENRRTTKEDRSFKKLMNITDNVCKRHHLFVIAHPEQTKGMSHWEWDMNRQGLSWKAKLKYAIDQVVKVSEDFDDFLAKCAEYGILVEYNPDHKIDLKFMLAEQKEHNPRAKFTRAKTLGWYYETEQIKGRIAQYIGGMIYVPRTKVRVITPKAEENKFVRDAIDRENMKLTSKALNILTKYGVTVDEAKKAAISAYAVRTALVQELNHMADEIRECEAQAETLRKLREVRPYFTEYKSLSGRRQEKYKKANCSFLEQYHELNQKMLKWYPSGHTPTAEKIEQHIAELTAKREQKNAEYNAAKLKAEELSQAAREIEQYLRQEHSRDQQQKRKRNDLE
ncbi:MAG: relaxase/mobilization nuclease domain-containing protein [Ruminococcus sp.]|nr:relaxase/mobilization nuclease domain-containing protein [Ruminococcus sp.]